MHGNWVPSSPGPINHFHQYPSACIHSLLNWLIHLILYSFHFHIFSIFTFFSFPFEKNASFWKKGEEEEILQKFMMILLKGLPGLLKVLLTNIQTYTYNRPERTSWSLLLSFIISFHSYSILMRCNVEDGRILFTHWHPYIYHLLRL